LEQTDESIELPEFEFPEGKICLMLGNEVTGLNEELFPWIDHFVEIPQYGEKHSLNVSVAAGVALYALLASRIPNASSLIEK
ncbi:MAG: TrmH family RNA methyltransferase, partial [Balneolaceae bacterium]